MIRLSLATPADDATLRTLLRDNPMPSWVSMSMTREPDFFAGANRFGREWAVLAREVKDAAETTEAVGMYVCAEQPLYWNGVETDMGYLGSLRVAPRYRHRLRILKEGYASIRRFSPGRRCSPWYTAIASENLPARRLLEANLRGLPRYRPLNEMVSLALPRTRGRRHGLWRALSPAESGRQESGNQEAMLKSLCDFHNRHARRHQCAPVLTPARVRASGAAFHVIDGQAGPMAVMALWNQQAYKQVMAYAYRPPLGALLPLYNGYARLAKKVVLPPRGQTLDQTALAFLAVAPELEREITALIEDALALCPTAVMSFGLHAAHGWLEPLRRKFAPATYRSCIYAVDFNDVHLAGETIPPDGRDAQPEVALL